MARNRSVTAIAVYDILRKEENKFRLTELAFIDKEKRITNFPFASDCFHTINAMQNYIQEIAITNKLDLKIIDRTSGYLLFDIIFISNDRRHSDVIHRLYYRTEN